jgi:hypothetical protein
MELLQGNACLHKAQTMEFSVRKENLPRFYSHYENVEGKQIWVAMSGGTLVINGGRMLKGIQVKLLNFMCIDLGRDRPIAGSMVLL